MTTYRIAEYTLPDTIPADAEIYITNLSAFPVVELFWEVRKDDSLLQKRSANAQPLHIRAGKMKLDGKLRVTFASGRIQDVPADIRFPVEMFWNGIRPDPPLPLARPALPGEPEPRRLADGRIPSGLSGGRQRSREKIRNMCAAGKPPRVIFAGDSISTALKRAFTETAAKHENALKDFVPSIWGLKATAHKMYSGD